MVATLKIDKGTAEKLIEWISLKPEQSRNLTGKELTLELRDEDILIEFHKHNRKKLLEISDFNGSFGIWFELKDDKIKRLKEILEKMGP